MFIKVEVPTTPWGVPDQSASTATQSQIQPVSFGDPLPLSADGSYSNSVTRNNVNVVSVQAISK